MNHKRGEYPLTVNGVDFILKFDMNAFAELEYALGEPLSKILTHAEKNMGIRFIRAALFTGLQWDPRFKGKFTIEKAGSMITQDNLSEISTAIGNALISALTGKSPDQVLEEVAAFETSTSVPLPQEEATAPSPLA